MTKRNFIFTLAILASSAMMGQGLHKEITVEQEIVPLKRDASRITVLPTVSLPAITPARLSFSDRVVTTQVPNTITTLEPVAYGDNLYSSPYRGYVALGLGAPLFNADFSAGYRILDTDKTRLSVWGQFNSDLYTQKVNVVGEDSPLKLYHRDLTATLGADLHQAIGKTSFLDASVDYTYGHNNIPYGADTYSRSLNKVNATAAFNSRHEGLMYSAQLKYQHFGYCNLQPENHLYTDVADYTLSPAKQNLVGVRLQGLLPVGEPSYFGLDLNADFLHTSAHAMTTFPHSDYIPAGSSTTGLVTLTPHYLFRNQTFTAKIGVDVDITVNDGKVFHISPDVLLAWTPSQVFGVEVRADGGSRLNTLASLYDVTPYSNASVAYPQSHIPYNIDGKITIGPFYGAYIDLFGGYAKANDWLMPVATYGFFPGGQVFEPADISGWHAGAAIGYDYRKILSARVSYETASNDQDRCYYQWRDRARHVVNAELKVRPITPLLITLNWEFRAGRRMFGYTEYPVQGNITTFETYATRLGTVSTLNLSAGYSVTEALTVFINGENLLNRRYTHLGDRYSQGITAMIGAALKF